MSIVKLFNLFNPNVNICCSYVAKYVFCNIFPMLQKMVPTADKHYMQDRYFTIV